MALLLPRLRPLIFGSALGLSTYTLLNHRSLLRPHYLDSIASSPKDWSINQYQADAKAPVITKKGGLSPRAIRQFSTGSILGVVGGLAVSTFSKPLAVLIGLLILGAQMLESRGIHVVPYSRMQGWFKSVDLRSAVQDNVAFKVAFGGTFALVGFLDF